MRLLSAQDILEIWEKGHDQHDLDRALTILEAACPDRKKDELAALPIAQRDRDLISLREGMFGHTLTGFSICPQCQERLEITLSTRDILFTQVRFEEQYELLTGDFILKFRLPNSYDLAAITHCKDISSARTMLGKRCVEQALVKGDEISIEDLPDVAIEALSDKMSKSDPQSELILDLECPECENKWQILFDIVRFFWTEINSHARQLLDDVHTLAYAYGWRETDILSMSAVRRQSYIDRVI
jgi:hypothetical protein